MRLRTLRARLPRVEFAPGTPALIVIFVGAIVLGTLPALVRGPGSWFLVWSSSVLTAFTAGWVLLRVDELHLKDLPGFVRWPVQGIGLAALWYLAGYLYVTYDTDGPEKAFQQFALQVCLPLAQGLFFGAMFYVGARSLRRRNDG